MPSRRLSRAVLAAPLLAVPLALTGCAAGEGTGDGDGVKVLASFYPLQYVAQQVGGDLVTVDNLTPPTAEPHDLELAPAQVRAIGDADVVVYLSGFQPAVDEGVASRQPEHVVDAADVVTLQEHPGSAEHAGSDDGHDHGSLDPHFWLDPTQLATVGHAVADQLAAADPGNTNRYTAGAEALEERLTDLDTRFADGLAACEGATLVTSHAAFGYLAERYGLAQVGVSELDPESEPSPARLREIGRVVAEHGVTTLFSETLVSPKVTETLASDLGVRTATLDPLEGLTDGAPTAGTGQADGQADYESVMLANLAALQEGLACS